MTTKSIGYLTGKQRRFCDEYLIDLNATRAAVRAGYSAKSAEAIGYENLRKPQISAALAERRSTLSRQAEITQELVIRGLRKEAEYCGPGASHGARVQAWTQLGRHLGLFDRDNEPKSPLRNLPREQLRELEVFFAALEVKFDPPAADHNTSVAGGAAHCSANSSPAISTSIATADYEMSDRCPSLVVRR